MSANPKVVVSGLGEFRVLSLRETPADLFSAGVLDSPGPVAEYWRAHIANHERFNPDVETFWIICVNTRRRALGCVLISTGTMDTLLVHPREVFRPAIVAGAAAIVLMHNHPSGDPSPSEGDIKVTRDLIRAGQLLKIDVLDHVIMGDGRVMGPGHPGHVSLRELGYFFS